MDVLLLLNTSPSPQTDRRPGISIIPPPLSVSISSLCAMVSSVSTQTPGHGVAATPIVNRACTILHRPAPLPKAGQIIAAAAAAAIPDTPAYTLPSTTPPPPGSFDAVYGEVASLPDLPGGASRRLPRYTRARGRPAGAGVAA